MSDMGDWGGGGGAGADAAESIGAAEARERERRTSGSLPLLVDSRRWATACSVRVAVAIVVVALVAAWLLTAFNSGG